VILNCLCGASLSNTGCPNDIEHLLISSQSKESLQDLVDEEVKDNGEIDMWFEHWEESKSIIVWKCYECGRLYLDAEGDPEKVIVYKIEQQGIEAERRTTIVPIVTVHPTIPNTNAVELKSVVWKQSEL
jgi:hypothetical protein